MKNIAINGLGRVGRLILRRYLDAGYKNFKIVALNDPMPREHLLYLLKYDSVHGPLRHRINISDDRLFIADEVFPLYQLSEPDQLPWAEQGIDIVIESSGQFSHYDDAMQHIDAGAKSVLITAPCKDADITLVLGVNEDQFDAEQHRIISNASCTTNCLAPVLKVLIDTYGVERAMVTTVHAYTASQSLVDVAAKKMHRGRAGGLNIIPTSTGADACTILVLPELKDRLLALALRVPVANVALVDISAQLSDEYRFNGRNSNDINELFIQASQGSMKNIIQYSDEQLVSSDIIGNSHSAIIHGLATKVLQGNMINLFAWYDNEYGYACRCLDITEKISLQQLTAEPVV